MLTSVSRLEIPLHKTRDSLHIIKSLLAVHSGEKIKNIYYNAHSDRPTSDATLAKMSTMFLQTLQSRCRAVQACMATGHLVTKRWYICGHVFAADAT